VSTQSFKTPCLLSIARRSPYTLHWYGFRLLSSGSFRPIMTEPTQAAPQPGAAEIPEELALEIPQTGPTTSPTRWRSSVQTNYLLGTVEMKGPGERVAADAGQRREQGAGDQPGAAHLHQGARAAVGFLILSSLKNRSGLQPSNSVPARVPWACAPGWYRSARWPLVSCCELMTQDARDSRGYRFAALAGGFGSGLLCGGFFSRGISLR